MIKLVLCYLPCFWVSPFALFCCDLCPLFVFQPSPPLLISPCFPLCSGFLFSGFCFFLRLPSHALSFFCSWLCFGLIFSCAGMKMKARTVIQIMRGIMVHDRIKFVADLQPTEPG
ncbi:hypothetical protein NC652_035023 [Populus alba x Populus x berolinensis]|nr:hypothetical protein NC652_035023 [Populus alba x Populus x berolinensis]